MAIETVMDFWAQYWWVVLIALAIIIFAIAVRKGLLGARLKSLFKWPPEP